MTRKKGNIKCHNLYTNSIKRGLTIKQITNTNLQVETTSTFTQAGTFEDQRHLSNACKDYSGSQSMEHMRYLHFFGITKNTNIQKLKTVLPAHF